jgi:hypothetical protein
MDSMTGSELNEAGSKKLENVLLKIFKQKTFIMLFILTFSYSEF